ncbi:hypothetical protein FJ651_08005 [Paucihalobacter ruber]|uniref:Lipoprotein n=1 Tax=Paucihalobacter ruber TaxID=2567861 RepID=A0A506PJW8_9FLAO|nr:hypothetical protein [Paucihalobacter ruber]TPV34091.1 hypothetical protein FJ651_08005 [Paucihalobacter ruber]
MKNIFIVIFALFLIACSNEDKTILLPHVETSVINEIKDVSPVFIFFNPKKKDSVELNRKNLISTTNWLFNIDKRHQLQKIIPSINELQEKRKDAKLHKNEKARNYFSCNDLEKQTLGFIDFTEVEFAFNDRNTYIKELINRDDKVENVVMEFKPQGEINIYLPSNHKLRYKQELSKILEAEVFKNETPDTIYLAFDGLMNFQEFITYQRQIEKLAENNIAIAPKEFILY